MNTTVGGPQAQIVMMADGRSNRAKMTRVGTVLIDTIVMRTTDGHEFIAKKDKRGILTELTVYEVFEELESYHKALIATIPAPQYTMPEFTPHLDYKAADEDYVRPNFAAEDAKVFL